MINSDYADLNVCSPFDENCAEPGYDSSIEAFKGIIYGGVASVCLWSGIFLLIKWFV